jgi:hypothetical protein
LRAANAQNERILRPLIELHLTAYDAVLDDLGAAHAAAGENPRLDLVGTSRHAAMWLVTGRCIGLARASLDLVRLGYASEAVPTIRSLHEANRLLSVSALGGEDELVSRWIAGRTVGRAALMHASQRQEEAIRAEMLQAGVEPPMSTKSYFDCQYGRLSEVAHQRRKHLLDQVAADARLMAAGPHPDWRARSATVDHFGDILGELLSAGGHTLAQLRGHGLGDSFQRALEALMTLKRKVALSEVARGGGDDGR